MGLRPALQVIVRSLLADTAVSGKITLDEIGVALDTLSVTTLEIDEVMVALEAAGRTIEAPEGQHGEKALHVVLKTAREMHAELGRFPSPLEISLRAKMPLDQVQHALALAKVMAR